MQEPVRTRCISLIKRDNTQIMSISDKSEMLCYPSIISVDFSQRHLDVPGTTFNASMVKSIVRYKVWDEITIASQTSTVQPLKFGSVYVILSYNLMGMWLLIHVSKGVLWHTV